ncbi:MAG: diguanylate cyclase domain-containing protein [Thermoanaerobaculaceae bacterium]
MNGLFLLLLSLVASLSAAQPEPRVVDRLPERLGGEWWFRVGHDPAWSSPFREKTHWQLIKVPRAWELQGFRGYNGHAWYRFTFKLSPRFANETLGIDLGHLGDADEVFLNGQRIGGSGSFPPMYQSATLQRRIYPLPQSKLRYGEYNEIAVHVYNDGRFGGFLGPTPKIDSYRQLAMEQTARDVVLWTSAGLLLALAALHTILAVLYRTHQGPWLLVAFLVAFACYELTYTAWGPYLLWSSGTVFRLNVALFLLSVGLFLPSLISILGQAVPTPFLVFTSLTALGAAFAMVWRRTSDLYLWIYMAEVGIVIIVVTILRKFWERPSPFHRGQWPLLITAAPFFASVFADVAVDLGWLPRPSLPGLVLYSSVGVIPFAFSVSFVLLDRQSREHASGLLPPLGLLPYPFLVKEVKRRLATAATTPFAVAFCRLTTAAGTAIDVTTILGELRCQLRHCDLLSQFSPETLAMLLDDLDEREAVAHLERIRRALRQGPGGLQIRLTAGLAASRPARFATAEELLKAAEAALFAARSEGGDCVATAP